MSIAEGSSFSPPVTLEEVADTLCKIRIREEQSIEVCEKEGWPIHPEMRRRVEVLMTAMRLVDRIKMSWPEIRPIVSRPPRV